MKEFQLMSDRKQYALVSRGKLVPSPDGAPILTAYRDEPPEPRPEGTWLPVVYVDSEPFDSEKHYRLKPTCRVAGDRVERVYSVIAKSEAA
jgi:hypothetical protein